VEPRNIDFICSIDKAVVYALRGPVRDPVDGRHRRVVVYASPDARAPHVLAAILRNVADELYEGRAAR
jgi:hypothetical protein